MKEDIDFYRDEGYILDMGSCKNAICPSCGSGEVYQYAQTLDMPMYMRCLNCGCNEPSGEFYD